MNKTLLVLGASADIGKALIKKVYNDYDEIIAHYNSTEKPLQELQEEIGEKLHLMKADFSSENDTMRFIAEVKSQFVPTHIVHLPAPKAENERFIKKSWALYQTNLDTQLRSAVLCLSAFLPAMVKLKNGKVVLMLTSYTVGVPPKFMADYVVTKYAMLGLMKALAAEYAPKNICVNGVSASMVSTKFISNISEMIINQNASNNPMGRNAVVEDVTAAFGFLLSDEASFVTGQNLVVAGGEQFS